MSEPGSIRFHHFGFTPFGRSPLFADFNLEIKAGERIALIGPSGSGKSSLLNALIGALGDTIPGVVTGDVRAHGTVGLVSQSANVVATTCGRDVAFGMENQGRTRADIWAGVDQALTAVGLEGFHNRPSDALSGGESQRLALAGVLAMQPAILLLDEPTAMLDESTAAKVRAHIFDVVERTSATTIVVEHRIGPWLDFVDRVIVLDHGTIVDPESVDIWLPDREPPRPQILSMTQRPRDITELILDGVDAVLERRSFANTVTTHALKNFSMRAYPHQMLSLRGSSGAGKSTALEILAGVRAPDSGVVRGYPKPPHQMRSKDVAARVGWVPQNPEHSFIAHTVAAEIALTSKAVGRDLNLEEVLHHFDLVHVAQVNPYRLSGGEQKRLSIAAGSAHRPAVAVFDEPTVGLDPRQWARVTGWLRSLADSGSIVVSATHDDLLPEDRRIEL